MKDRQKSRQQSGPQSTGKDIGKKVYKYAATGFGLGLLVLGAGVANRILESRLAPPSGISEGEPNSNSGFPNDSAGFDEGCSMFTESTPYDQAARTANLVRGSGGEPREQIIQVIYPDGQEIRGSYDEIYAQTNGQIPEGTRVCVLRQ